MKKVFLLIVLCAVQMTIWAASVSWKEELMTYSYTADGVDVYALHSPYLVIYGKSDGAIVTFWAEADSYPEFANRFVLANVGDRISAAYIDDKTEYFYWGDFDRPGGQKAHADYSIVIATDESAYLAYSTSSSSDPENLELGWIEIIVGEDGLLKVGHYQVDGGNGGLFVGSTPEPSCGMLLLVGVFVSLLKRPRRLAGCGRGESAHGKSVERRVA